MAPGLGSDSSRRSEGDLRGLLWVALGKWATREVPRDRCLPSGAEGGLPFSGTVIG